MTYLDSASAGLPSKRVSDVMQRLTLDWASKGENWEEWLMDVVNTRRVFAKMIGGKTEEVGVVPSVSVGLASLASALKLKSRRKVVTSSLNFPTNVVLWQRMKEAGLLQDVTVLKHRRGKVPLDTWEKSIDDKTAVVAVDYVSWFSGARENIKEITEIAHRHGALVVVDAFHALSVIPLDVKRDGVDLLACGFYKWLCGPHGAACVYVRRDLLQDFMPSYIGWHGIKDNVIERLMQSRDPFDVPFALNRGTPSATAARFEWGTWAPGVVAGAMEAMKLAIELGLGPRFSEIKKRMNELRSGLEEIGLRKAILTPSPDENQGGGILTFGVRKHSAFVSDLRKEGIVVSGRFDHVRISPHFYNTAEDVEELIHAVKIIIKKRKTK